MEINAICPDELKVIYMQTFTLYSNLNDAHLNDAN